MSLPGVPLPVQGDSILLMGVQSPGTCKIRGAGSPRHWDERPGYGIEGGNSVYTGKGLAKFDVDFYAWTVEHFLFWEVFARLTLVLPSKAIIPLSMGIVHPLLNAPPLNINQVVVTNVTQFEEVDETGLYMRTVSFLEYKKAKPFIAKPREGPPAVGNSGIGPPPDPESVIIQNNAATILAKSAR